MAARICQEPSPGHQEGLASQSKIKGSAFMPKGASPTQIKNHPSIWKEETRSPKVGKIEHF